MTPGLQLQLQLTVNWPLTFRGANWWVLICRCLFQSDIHHYRNSKWGKVPWWNVVHPSRSLETSSVCVPRCSRAATAWTPITLQFMLLRNLSPTYRWFSLFFFALQACKATWTDRKQNHYLCCWPECFEALTTTIVNDIHIGIQTILFEIACCNSPWNKKFESNIIHYASTLIIRCSLTGAFLISVILFFASQWSYFVTSTDGNTARDHVAG